LLAYRMILQQRLGRQSQAYWGTRKQLRTGRRNSVQPKSLLVEDIPKINKNRAPPWNMAADQTSTAAETDAATKIQSAARRTQAHQEVRASLEAHTSNTSGVAMKVIAFTSKLKVKVAGPVVSGMREALSPSVPSVGPDVSESGAATQIQSAARCKQAKRTANARRAQVRETGAATQIQSVARRKKANQIANQIANARRTKASEEESPPVAESTADLVASQDTEVLPITKANQPCKARLPRVFPAGGWDRRGSRRESKGRGEGKGKGKGGQHSRPSSTSSQTPVANADATAKHVIGGQHSRPSSTNPQTLALSADDTADHTTPGKGKGKGKGGQHSRPSSTNSQAPAPGIDTNLGVITTASESTSKGRGKGKGSSRSGKGAGWGRGRGKGKGNGA